MEGDLGGRNRYRIEFTYEYDPNTNNIAEITYVHRDSNTVDYTYDNLDRLTLAEYSIDDNNETFTIDDLGNRDSVNVRDGNEKDKIGNHNWWLSLVPT